MTETRAPADLAGRYELLCELLDAAARTGWKMAKTVNHYSIGTGMMSSGWARSTATPTATTTAR